jgi:hypothetical protein
METGQQDGQEGCGQSKNRRRLPASTDETRASTRGVEPGERVEDLQGGRRQML